MEIRGLVWPTYVVCFQYYETKISKTAPNSMLQYVTLDPNPSLEALALTLTLTLPLPVELCPEKKSDCLFFFAENLVDCIKTHRLD